MKCFTCDKLTGKYKIDLQTCGRCGEVKKIDLVRIVLEKTPIYLSEDNRNKGGRPLKLKATAQHDVNYAHKTGESVADLARKYKVSRGTIYKTLSNASNL